MKNLPQLLRILGAFLLFFVLQCSSPTGGGGGSDGGGGSSSQQARVEVRPGAAGQFSLSPGSPVFGPPADISIQEAVDPNATFAEIDLAASGVEVFGFDDKNVCTATVMLFVDDWRAVSPCDTGVMVGTFTITTTDDVVTSVSANLILQGQALDKVLAADFSLCMVAEADCRGSLSIEQLLFLIGGDLDEDGDFVHDSLFNQMCRKKESVRECGGTKQLVDADCVDLVNNCIEFGVGNECDDYYESTAAGEDCAEFIDRNDACKGNILGNVIECELALNRLCEAIGAFCNTPSPDANDCIELFMATFEYDAAYLGCEL